MVLLNSKLLNWYFRFENFHMVGKPLAEVKIAFLERLPARIGFQQEFAEFGKFMLQRNRDLHTLTTRFLRHLTAKHPTLTTTRKLADWPALSFGEFLKEIRQQKIMWSLKEEAEWMDYFMQEQSAARALRDDIARTDAEIDRLVYALYGLTAEEIAVVEGGRRDDEGADLLHLWRMGIFLLILCKTYHHDCSAEQRPTGDSQTFRR